MDESHQLAGDLIVIIDADFSNCGIGDSIVVDLNDELVVYDEQLFLLILGLALLPLFAFLLLNPTPHLLGLLLFVVGLYCAV